MNIKQIASELAACYIEKAEQQIQIDQIAGEVWKREMALTPAEGWPGKNAEIRDIEKARTLENDPVYSELKRTLTACKETMSLLDGTIQAHEAERRGAEWDIRANLVTVMAGKLRGETASAVEDSAFDDAAGREVDDQVFAEPDDIPLQDSLAALRKVSDELAAMTNGEYDLSGVANYQTTGGNSDDELPF